MENILEKRIAKVEKKQIEIFKFSCKIGAASKIWS